jgi:L-ascorbate metabolism protein UlaG (beta-lactamase superfamily)
MHVRLIRHATLLVHVGPHRLLVDPMLDPAEARPPVAGTPNAKRNPLVDLPEPPEVVVKGIDGALVTHLHSDHFDATARRLLPPELPLLCQPHDGDALREGGARDVRPVADELEWEGVRIIRTEGRHGTGELAERLGPVSGFVLVGEEEPVLYVVGDSVWSDPVRAALDAHVPDLVVVNAGGARYTEGGPITMTADDVVAVARHAPQARVIAVHLEAINHCLETRADLHQRVHDEGLREQVTIPEDGAEVPLLAVGG